VRGDDRPVADSTGSPTPPPSPQPARTAAPASREIVVTAFQSASGFVNLFTPTSAVIMGGLALPRHGSGIAAAVG
jgi:hypothetical protein